MIEKLQWFDHTVVALFTIGMGGWAFLKIDGFIRRVESGAPGARVREYQQTIINQWCVTTFALICWFALATRAAADLGLTWTFSWHTWLGAGLTVLALGIFWWQRIGVRGSDDVRKQLREQLGPVKALLPHTLAEFWWFIGVSLTAGICEEILYRGYLLAYLKVWMPTWLAATLASVIFGIAHSYQMKMTKGPGNVIRTMVFGGICMALYLLTGSLWCSMVLHIAIDYQAGYLAYRVFANNPQSKDSDGVTEAQQDVDPSSATGDQQ